MRAMRSTSRLKALAAASIGAIMIGGILVPAGVASAAPVSGPPSGFTIVKSVSPQTGVEAGDTVTYTFRLINRTGGYASAMLKELDFSGNGALSAFTCDDPGSARGSVTSEDNVETTCTATYLVTEEDVASCELTNTAGSMGLNPLEPEYWEEDVRPVVPLALGETATSTVTLQFDSVACDDVVPPGPGVGSSGSLAIGSLGSLALGSLGLGSLGSINPGTPAPGPGSSGSLAVGSVGSAAVGSLGLSSLGTNDPGTPPAVSPQPPVSPEPVSPQPAVSQEPTESKPAESKPAAPSGPAATGPTGARPHAIDGGSSDAGVSSGAVGFGVAAVLLALGGAGAVLAIRRTS